MKRCARVSIGCAIAGLCLIGGCGKPSEAEVEPARPAAAAPTTALPAKTSPPATSPAIAASTPIVAAARAQVGRTTAYDGAYVQLAYPGGDVPIEKGVCTDVVIRALRDGVGRDLQQLVHEDMRSAFSAYPQTWGLRKPDPNIDHRRVPNLARYFTRKDWAVPITGAKEDYHPGDLVACTVPPALPHIMIVSDRRNAQGVPQVIHNIGQGAREEDRLFEFAITGHFRMPANADHIGLSSTPDPRHPASIPRPRPVP